MTNNKKFVLRLSDEDLKALRNVSEITKRNKSAVFRWALQECGAIFCSAMINFEPHGTPFDRENGKQIGLALERFTQVIAQEREFNQLPMFGGVA